MFPIPMPVMHDAQVYPRLFVTNKSLGLAYLPFDDQIHGIENNKTFLIKGSLCFVFVTNLNDSSHCIHIYNQSAAWLQESSWGEHNEVVTKAVLLYGWWPSLSGGGYSSPQPRWAPYCKGAMQDDSPVPWTGCQDRLATWAVDGHFSFSPYISVKFNSSHPGHNITHMDPERSNVNPFDLWLLCGINGSCTDLSPMVMLGGGRVGRGSLSFDWKGTVGNAGHSSGSFSWSTTKVSYRERSNLTFSPTPVCVWPPFLWLVSNDDSMMSDMLSCSPQTCFYTLCWNATKHRFAMVTRMPRFVPVPVESPSSLQLFRVRRDFGLSAVIVGIVAAAAVGALSRPQRLP